jgi:hypothetical protein
MTSVHFRAELKSQTGLDRDTFVNTFNVTGLPNSSYSTLDAVADAIVDFYNVIPTGGLVSIASMLSETVSRASLGLVIKAYDVTAVLGGTPAGSPDYTALNTMTTVAGSSNNLPAEVAFAVTLEAVGRSASLTEVPDGADADSAPDRPKQRHTGRIYLGPFNDNVLDDSSGVVRPHAALRDTARLAVKKLDATIRAFDSSAGLAVWSRKNAAMYRLEAVSTDNAFDTMRSRGEAASARTRTLLP